jgi:hypothetical protein
MRNPKAPEKLLTFPARTLAPDSIEYWIDQILHTKDHLVDALEFLRTAYNEMLAGMPVRKVDDVLAQVEAILKSKESTEKYTVVAALRTRAPRPPKAVPSSVLPFPGRRRQSPESRDSRR